MLASVRFSCFVQAGIELRRLRALWLTLQFGFEAATTQVKRRVKDDKKLGTSPLKLANGTRLADSHFDFINKSRAQMPRYAREVVFVRLISTLEVFLVDLVRNLFVHDTSLFHDHRKMLEISHAELLGTNDLTHLRNRLINGELRQLHSKGIRETAKYYDSRLGLSFAALGTNLTSLWEMVDRRHLLVHRLGRADESYRRKYGYDKRGALTISTDYLAEALDLVGDFVAKMEAKVADVLAPPTDNAKEAPDRIDIRIEVTAASTEGERALRPSFAFVVVDRLVGERTATLDDILAGAEPIEDGGQVLELSGTTDETDAYIRELRRRQKGGLLTYGILEKKRIKVRASSRKVRAPAEEVSRAVATSLPAEPWPTGIHKLIAAELGITNSECSRAITTIRADPELYALVGTRVLPISDPASEA